MGHLAEHSVVVAFASAQAMPRLVETHAWDDARFYLPVFIYRQQFAYRFHDVETALS